MNLNSRIDSNGEFYVEDLLPRNKHLYSGGFSVYQPNYNMDSASLTQTNRVSFLPNLIQTSPITPQLANFGNGHISTSPFLARDESSSLAKAGDFDFIRMLQDDAPHKQCDELLQSIVDSSCAINSTPWKAIKNSEKQRNLEIDLNKTPEQKPPKRRQLNPTAFSEEKYNFLSCPVDESLSLYEETQENLVTIILDEASKKRHDELLKDLTETLSADIPIPGGEIKELEKGSGQVIDLNKTPEQKTPKRRKHRPKVITEGKPKRSSKSVKPKDTKETPSVKRKYVRRKGIKESATPHVNLEKIKDLSTASKTNSCRRTLKFDREKTGEEDLVKKHDGKDVEEGNMGNIFYSTRPNITDLCTQSNGVCSANSDVHVIHQDGMMAENVQPSIQGNVADMNQMMTPFRSQSERMGAVDPSCKSAYFNAGNLLNDRRIIDQRNAYQYENGFNYGYSSAQQHIHADGTEQFVNQGLWGSTCSQTVPRLLCNTNEARGSKREHSHTIHNTQLCSINALDSSLLCQEVTQMDGCYRQGGSLDVGSLEIPGKEFETGLYANLYKRHSTSKAEEGCSNQLDTRSITSINSVGFIAQMQAMLSQHNRSNQSTERQSNLTKEISGDRYLNSVVYGNKFQRQPISHEPHPKVDRRCKINELAKIISYESYDSLTTVKKCNGLQPFPHLKAPEQEYACRHSDDIMLKKRQADRPILSKLGSLATKKVQEQDYSFGFQKLPDKTTGLLVYEISRQLKDLNLNENERSNRGAQNAIVPYKGSGAVIPYVESEYIKKRKSRPRVELDLETERIWNLLMGKEGIERLEDHEKGKEKWWEEERKVFRGRADSFIAKMHLVQGDRRFSQWKGSVVDSVIGVFLTQNVSDHLSSSAFMSLAARFPVKSTTKNKTQDGTGMSIVTNELTTCQLYPENSIRWDGLVPRFAMPQISMNHHNHKENSGIVKNFNEVQHQIVEIVEEEVISSQDSFDSTITQISGEARSCSGSNSEVEDPIVSYNSGSINFSNFMNTKPTATTTMSQKSLSDLDSSTLDKVPEHRHGQLPDGKQDSLTSEWKEIDDLHGHSLFDFLISIGNQEEHVQSSNSHLHMTPDCGVLEVEGREAFSEDAISSVPSTASGSSIEKNNTFHSLNIEELAETLSKTRAEENEQVRSQETARMEHGESASKYPLHLQGISIQSESHCGQNLHLDNYGSCARNKTFSLESALVTDPSEESVAPAKMQQTSTLGNALHVPAHREKSRNHEDRMQREHNQINFANNDGDVRTENVKRRKVSNEKKNTVDWDSLRKQVEINGLIKKKTKDTMDSIDYEAIRLANVHEISDAIKERGMNNMLAERIKGFLNRLVSEHGSIDLEWLRDVPPDKTKDYLLSVRGLGLKSVECVRLLTLRHLAFPVDTNVGRIAVRLGWVPLKPLPESLQLHLLELYPVLESIQKYLWPRLCKLDQRTLYELHYQLITFGKVFCTKSKPNCNACPMRGECKHFASAFASARLSLPGPDEKRVVNSTISIAAEKQPAVVISRPLPILPAQTSTFTENALGTSNCEPIVEVPATPEQELNEIYIRDIEDSFYDDSDEIPTIKLSLEEFKTTLQNYIPEGDMSKALVALNPEVASLPTAKLKNVSRLRTEHRVYELPDSHPLLNGMEIRQPDDPSPYLLAIWTPGETADSIQPPEQSCGSQDPNRQCYQETCFTCSSRREANSQTVRGTLLVPCKTAMRGSFPLNGTYFQVNEMFADHSSSVNPINVPRAWLWNLPRRMVYFGTSVSTIFKGLTTEEIQQCFWRGFVCVRGFDKESRAPRPLMARLHFPASKLAKLKNG